MFVTIRDALDSASVTVKPVPSTTGFEYNMWQPEKRNV
jgi:hypothetical protein